MSRYSRYKKRQSKIRRAALAAITAACVMVVPFAAPAAAESGASPFIRDLGARAIAVLQSPEMGVAERDAKFHQLLNDGFDMKLIGRFVLGRYWRQASPEARREYLALFGDYVTRTYSARLGGYAGEKLVVVSEQAMSNGKDYLVNTRLARAGGPAVKAAWRVRNGKKGLRIIDVVVEGMSMIVTQRDEFASVVRARGIDGLIATLRARTRVATASR